MTTLRIAAMACAAVVAGCAAAPVLEPRSAEIPGGVDFSGDWQLRVGQRSAAPGRATDTELVRVFLETGQALRITQTDHGIFISFDRAVVEEYRFGEHREVSVGAIIADRVSGWDGASYVVETLDEDGAKLTDTYRLAGDGDSLRREIVIERRDKRLLEIVQVFDRQQDG